MGEGKQETGLCKGKDQKLQSAEIFMGIYPYKVSETCSKQKAERMREDGWSFLSSTLPWVAAQKLT